MVDQHVLSSRLSALEGYLAELRSFVPLGRNRYVAEPALHHLAERMLHLACECVLDIAQHVIADQGFRQPATYKDAMEILSQEGLLAAALSARLQRWMGLRNVLVHFYIDIDHGRTFDAIANDLGDLDQFAAGMARLLRTT